MLTSDELRKAFLEFFKEKGHRVIPSSPLIPKGDPTLLLTTAGMVQIKPYFMGREKPPSHRLASCQKCFRTTDIESVGDASHLTFFEMLGNFSVGDYFKQEAISWAWEFVTEWLKLSPERLWITIFLDDDESFTYWRKIGIPEERILRFGEEDNFWGPAGSSGPCGPCSEIHYDFGEGVGCGKPDCKPNCECGRFSEIWNLVFTQYNQDETGERTLLPKPNIDTGMGLERTTAALAGKSSVYETALFAPLLECIGRLSGQRYGADVEMDGAMRVVAEHGRGIAFLIADGVIPGNEGRDYVLRRLLRRAVLFGRRLGLDKPFLAEIARTTIEQMGHVYPELGQRRDFILQVVEMEEERFEDTLSTGLELIDSVMARKATRKAGEISGKDVFKLYDTYGFPVELTSEIVSSRGFSVDIAGFEKEMEKQRERARAAHRFEAKEAVKTGEVLDVGETCFVGYHCLEQESKILKLLTDSKSVASVGEGKPANLVLAETPFYGEMGGQVGDAGEITGPRGRFAVTDTVRGAADTIIHQGYVAEGSLAVEDEVRARVDGERRLDIARNHTATHLLQLALRQVLGGHVQQRGSLVMPERLRFDFSHLTAITEEELQKVNRAVNDSIRRNLRVYDEELRYNEAIKQGALALFDEKYGDTVRVLKIGEPAVSAELCGGTHVNFTGEIGYFHIVAESGIGAGLRRIEAVTGRQAEVFINQRLASLEGILQALGVSADSVEDRVSGLVAELDKEHKQILALERVLAQREAESLLHQAEVVNGVTLLSARVSFSDQQILREMADLLRDKLESAVIVLGAVNEGRPVFLAAVTPDLVARGYHAGEIVKQVSGVAGGGGGGKASLGQAGGRDEGKLDEALRLAKSLLQSGGGDNAKSGA